ncbi:MAG: UDP-3-O-acyl-N-acetylglucosamine deacetylase [Lentisphaerae bacterium]|nr:UDP-3-O-acyl-N-acetylglucosamine deacetylase [Lentisphaerota bacterium]
MSEREYGTILMGDKAVVETAYKKLADQPVDQKMIESSSDHYDRTETTISKRISVTGPGTFLGRAERTLTFRPSIDSGWWFDRDDLPNAMPIGVSVKNIWTTVRNIVLCSGSPHNYMRMVEHIIALKVGMGLDNVVISMDSGDPPLFDKGSMDLVEAVEEAGIVTCARPATYLAVKYPVTVAKPNGSFLTFLPPENGSKDLIVDCAISFRSAIGKQRIQFIVNKTNFKYGASARTNASLLMMIYCKTIGKIFADTRNLGYTKNNILIAGPRCYYNEPKMMHKGKSLEAVWHRATLDLLAAVALIDKGRFAGKIVSYKAGHSLDAHMIRELYQHDLLTTL